MKKTFEENGNTVRTEISGEFTEENILKALEVLNKMQEQIIEAKEYLNVVAQKMMKQKANQEMGNTNIPTMDEDTRLGL